MGRLFRIIAIVVAFVSGESLTASAQAPTDGQSIADPLWLRNRLEQLREANRLPALAAAVVVDGKVVAASAVGVRKIGSPVAVTRDDPFHLGSLAKPLSATMFGVLVDRGTLRWDMTMAEMFPELQPTMQPAYRQVTIAQLLSHTGGFPYQPHTPEHVTDAGAKTVAGRRYLYLKASVLDPPAATPGTKVIYSGGGIQVASAAERLTKVTYENLMHQLVFTPLGMTHAGFGCMASEGKIDGPWGHVLEGNQIKPISPDSNQVFQARAPVGRNVHCSIIDLARFAALHVEGGRGKSKFLEPNTFKKLQTAEPNSNFAPGWSTEHHDWSKGIVLAHNGSIGQNYAICRLSPSEGLGVCAMTNVGGDPGVQACESISSWLVMGIKRGWVTKADTLVTRPIPPLPDIPLESLQPVRATTGFGHVRTGKTAADTPLRLFGLTYANGVGVHANSELVYVVDSKYERFVAQVGIDDKQTLHGSIIVRVFAGRELLSQSPVLRGADTPWTIDVPLRRTGGGLISSRIRLVVDGTKDGIDWDLTNWIHAGFVVSRRSN
jgi:CubicO group peptidase (beta-lactamase class C family)